MSGTALVIAAAFHLGFQLGVTTLVYPALGEGPRETFARRHHEHSRRIAPVVVIVYGALLISCAWSLSDGADIASLVAGCTFVVVLAITGLGAAPRHGQLGRGWSSPTWSALLRLDRARLGLGIVLLLAATWGR